MVHACQEGLLEHWSKVQTVPTGQLGSGTRKCFWPDITMLIWKYEQSPTSTVEVIICVILLNIAQPNIHELFFPNM